MVDSCPTRIQLALALAGLVGDPVASATSAMERAVARAVLEPLRLLWAVSQAPPLFVMAVLVVAPLHKMKVG